MRQTAIATVSTAQAPTPAGHYVQATICGDVIYASGQLPVRPDGGHDLDAAFEAQTERALKNLLAVIEAAGGSSDSILKVTAYIVGAEHWPRFDSVYAATFRSARPARTVVPVAELHHGYLIEVDAIATIGAASAVGSGAS